MIFVSIMVLYSHFNTFLQCISQLKEQKVVVDELSNLKKNRVILTRVRDVACLCVLNYDFSLLINRRFIPSRGTATSSS